MENVYALIGRLTVMNAYSPNEVTKRYLENAINILTYGVNSDFSLNETTAALDTLSYKLCRHEAEVLRDTVEYLEGLKGDTGNEQ